MDARIVGALINGLSKQRFHNDAEMTDEFLAEQLFDGDGAGKRDSALVESCAV